MKTPGDHLSDETFADLLAGVAPLPEVQSHLDRCSHCRAELEVVGVSLQAFERESAAWALTEAPRRVPAPSRWELQLQRLPSWQAGLTAFATAALLAVGLGDTPARFHVAGGGPNAAMTSPSNAELAEDNRMMVSIDQELGYASAATQAGAGSASAHLSSSSGAAAVRD